MLDIFERILTTESRKTGEDVRTIADRRRPRIEHAQIMRPEDLGRAGALGGEYMNVRAFSEGDTEVECASYCECAAHACVSVISFRQCAGC